MTEAPLRNGTRVKYHGSLAGRRAWSFSGQEYVSVLDVIFTVSYVTESDPSGLSSDGHRYIIQPEDPSILVGPGKLDNCYSNVRRQSITVIEDVPAEEVVVPRD